MSAEKPDYKNISSNPQKINIRFLLITLLTILPFVITGLLITNFDKFSKEKERSSENKHPIDSNNQTEKKSPSIPPEPVYKYSQYPNFIYSQELQKIVQEIINFTENKGLPVNAISITLIDVNNKTIAEYQQEKLRFPASVVKLFWMVELYEHFERNVYPDNLVFTDDLQKMMVKSDNESSSRIIDKITNTESGGELEGEEYQKWLWKRYQMNGFFEKGGYGKIDISQKTYPIPYLNLYAPKGRDLQMRGNLEQPIRNKISTYQAARLMYEIVTDKAISPVASQSMKKWLLRDLKSEAWKNIDPNQGHFNPVMAFFGESLPTNLIFLSKAGWTSQTRQEVAFISSPDGKIAYILAIFAEDKSFSQDENIFPLLSKIVYQKMTLPGKLSSDRQ